MDGTGNKTSEFNATAKQSNRLPLSENGTTRDVKPHTSSVATATTSTWYENHREHRRERDHKKVRERSHDRDSWSANSNNGRDREKDRPNHRARENFPEDTRERFREEQQQQQQQQPQQQQPPPPPPAPPQQPPAQQPAYSPYAYGSADAAYMDSNRRATLGMMSNLSSYGLFAAMNSQQWGMNTLESMNMNSGMNVSASSTSTGLPVTAGMDVNANSGAGIAPFAFMGMTGDPNLFGMMGMGNYGQYGVMGTDSSMIVGPTKEIIHLNKCMLYPPNPNAPPPTTREKPLGCKTVFVGGLPENATDEIMKEIFERCGEILTIRMSKKNFCHIRFASESYIDNAIYFSGYRIKIENKDDAPNTGRLHVDYAQARDDQYEYECRQRSLQREARHREKLEQGYYDHPSPPPVVHYSDHEAAVLGEKLRNEETFQQAVFVLITWLERGECNKRNSGYFYSMIQSTNSHVRRLLVEKVKYEEELNKAKLMLKQQMQGILLQFHEIEKVFNSASLQKVWDHFTKPQRKNIELWKKQTEEIKNAHVEEVLNERVEDDMEVTDDEGENSKENEVAPTEVKEHFTDNSSKIVTAANEFNKLREENDSLRCQLEASQNEAVLLRSESEQERDLRERQLQALRQALQNMQKEMMSLTQKRTKEEAELNDLRAYKMKKEETKNEELGECSHERENEKINLRNFAVKEPDMELQRQPIQFNSSVTSTSNNVFNITSGEASLIGLISTFLNVHPFGASVDYICSYLHQIDCTIRARDVEALMKKFPSVFKEESTGIGASLEKKWTFCGFKSQL